MLRTTPDSTILSNIRFLFMRSIRLSPLQNVMIQFISHTYSHISSAPLFFLPHSIHHDHNAHSPYTKHFHNASLASHPSLNTQVSTLCVPVGTSTLSKNSIFALKSTLITSHKIFKAPKVYCPSPTLIFTFSRGSAFYLKKLLIFLN